jgi:creatinine amidohydrolase
MPRHWGELTTEDFDNLADDTVAVMVLGAIEQHGPHLPLSTDAVIGEGLLDAAVDRLPADFPLLVLPSMRMTTSPEHLSFAGTLSLSPEQSRAQVEALGAGVARAGIRRLVLFNAHGGNVGWMDAAALDLRRRLGLLVVKASYMRFEAPADLIGPDELRNGLHGGLAETAMMRRLAPELVRMDRAESFATDHPHADPLPPQGDAPWAWLAEDLNAAGVVGDAASATNELGQALIDHYAGRLTKLLEEVRLKAWPTE